MNRMNNVDKIEMLGCIIDIFEDWLEEKGVTVDDISNDEREEDNPAIIYGSDYDLLAAQVEEVLTEAGLLR